MRSIYNDGAYLAANPDWHEQDAPWKAAFIQRMLARHRITPKTICDIGCGTGEVLRLLWLHFEKSVTCTGYEGSPHAFDRATAKESQNLTFKRGTGPQHGDQIYDLVISLDVFEHVEDYFAFLRSVKEMGTYKLFHIPLDLSAQTVLRPRALLSRRSVVGHLHYFTKETALATLKDCGYQVEDFFYTRKFCETPQKGLAKNLLKTVLKGVFGVHEDFSVRLLGCSSLLVLAR